MFLLTIGQHKAVCTAKTGREHKTIKRRIMLA